MRYEMSMQPDLSISIVNTNNRDLTLQCLQSVFDTQGALKLEIFVVNNACTDGSSEAIRRCFSQVHLIENQEKLGFSTNNNLAFSNSSGRYLMLLNDDTIMMPNTLEKMVFFMEEHPDVGALGASFINPDGTSQLSYAKYHNPVYEGLRPFSEYILPWPRDLKSPTEVDSVGGACMMVRKLAATQVGFLDIQFDPLYSEEEDWCYRIKKAGWKVFFLPDAKVIHLGGSTMNRMPPFRYEMISKKKALFFRKHFGQISAIVFKVTLFLSTLLKLIFWGFLWMIGRPQTKERAQIFFNLLRQLPSF